MSASKGLAPSFPTEKHENFLNDEPSATDLASTKKPSRLAEDHTMNMDPQILFNQQKLEGNQS